MRILTILLLALGLGFQARTASAITLFEIFGSEGNVALVGCDAFASDGPVVVGIQVGATFFDVANGSPCAQALGAAIDPALALPFQLSDVSTVRRPIGRDFLVYTLTRTPDLD
jgi:hypothetical protein